MEMIHQLEKRIDTLEARNHRVDRDKAWETSTFRKVLLMMFTYASIGIFMYAIRIPNPGINAIVPTIGFLLSTLTLPFFKSLWNKYFYSKSN